MNPQSKAGAAPNANQTAAPHKPARANSHPLYPKPDRECNCENYRVDIESIIRGFKIRLTEADFDARLPVEWRNDFHGVCVTRVDNGRQTIILNSAWNEEQKQLTRGHELAHALLQRLRPGRKPHSDKISDDPQEERLCDQWMLELALPLPTLLTVLATVGLDLDAIAASFGVEASAVRTRLTGLGLIGRANR